MTYASATVTAAAIRDTWAAVVGTSLILSRSRRAPPRFSVDWCSRCATDQCDPRRLREFPGIRGAGPVNSLNVAAADPEVASLLWKTGLAMVAAPAAHTKHKPVAASRLQVRQIFSFISPFTTPILPRVMFFCNTRLVAPHPSHKCQDLAGCSLCPERAPSGTTRTSPSSARMRSVRVTVTCTSGVRRPGSRFTCEG